MNKYISRAYQVLSAKTAIDTYIVFAGNVFSAFLGFLFTLVAARALTVSDFGIFSAATNLMYIFISLSDVGISAGLVNFVANFDSEEKYNESLKYIKSALLLRFIIISSICLPLFIFPRYFASTFMATDYFQISFWVALISIGFIFYSLFPYVFQAKRKFVISIMVENSLGIIRLIATLIFFILGGLTLSSLLFSTLISTLGPIFIGFGFLGMGFLYVRINKEVIKSLIKFSGWLGVNNIISSLTGRLDVQMLAVMLGATATGLYSIPIRLSTFIIVLTASFSAVLAPRLASFKDKDKEKIYIKKASLFLLPMICGVLIWIVISKPFILVLFGDKYLESVNVFRLLALAAIPFLTTAPAVAAIIYAMKKTVYIGMFSFVQISALFILNYIFIPRFGVFGPAITLFIVNSLLASYVWFIVIKYYRR